MIPNRGLLLVALGLVALGDSRRQSGTGAYFAAAATSSANPLSTGALRLDESPTGAVFTASGLYPGNSTTPTSLTLQNSGTLPLQYTMTTSVTSGNASLAGAIDLSITEGACGGGVALYAGTLDAATLSLRPATPLALGESEALCFAATLPTTASSALQGQSVAVTFSFVARQT